MLSRRLFEQGAEDPESAAHAELVELLALKVLWHPRSPCLPGYRSDARTCSDQPRLDMVLVSQAAASG